MLLVSCCLGVQYQSLQEGYWKSHSSTELGLDKSMKQPVAYFCEKKANSQ